MIFEKNCVTDIFETSQWSINLMIQLNIVLLCLYLMEYKYFLLSFE
jgi:hypothetical protein